MPIVIDMSKKLLVLISLFVLSFTSVSAADKKDEDRSINNDTLTGGIVSEDGYYLPTSAKIPVVLRTPIDTRYNRVHDMITAQVTEDIYIGGHTLVPAKSFLHGHISELKGPGKFHKTPKVSLVFERLSLPGQAGDRRTVRIKASVSADLMKQSASRVNDGKVFKKKARNIGAAGGLAGGLLAHGVTRNIPTWQIFGQTALSDYGYFLGGAVGGAMLATSFMKKDDFRYEPGTELVVTMDATTMEHFEQEHKFSQDHLRDLDPEDAYDNYGEMRSESLLEKAKASTKKAENPYLSTI